MSRYLLLFIFTLPFILAGLLTAITQYKLKYLSRNGFIAQLIFWLTVAIALSLSETIYQALFTRGLTATESLSLFDVVQITAIIVLLYATNRLRLKVDFLDRRLKDLHQELSITLSSTRKK